MHHLLQVLGGKDVEIETLHPFILLLHLMKDMMYQSRLAHTARSDKRDITLVMQRRNHLLGFFLAVAEILGALITIYYKRNAQTFASVTIFLYLSFAEIFVFSSESYLFMNIENMRYDANVLKVR